MLLSLEKTNPSPQKDTKTKKTHTHTHTKTATKQTKTATTYKSPCLHHRWRCYQAIALHDQQIGPTSIVLLSP